MIRGTVCTNVCTYGSVGTPGGQLPGVTRPVLSVGRGILADYGEGNGPKAIINLIKAEQLFLREQDNESVANTRSLLRDLYEKYKFQPEDFKEVSVDDDLKK